jgi:hypothetical protein
VEEWRKRKAKERTLGSLILHEHLQDINVLTSREGVTSDTHAKRLSKSNLRRRVNRLVSEGSRTRDDTDGDDTGAVGADETGLRLAAERLGDLLE